jgi:hypothetical protein
MNKRKMKNGSSPTIQRYLTKKINKKIPTNPLRPPQQRRLDHRLINLRTIRPVRVSSIEGVRWVAGEVEVEGVAEAAMRGTIWVVAE